MPFTLPGGLMEEGREGREEKEGTKRTEGCLLWMGGKEGRRGR